MTEREEEYLVWQAGWERAHALARTTLSGVSLEANLNYPNALFRAFQTQATIWERLCSRECRSVDEVRAAAHKIGLLLDRDNERLSASGEPRIAFNTFQPVGQGTRIVTELEWMADVYDCALGSALFDDEPFNEMDLEGWRPWEIIYVTGLRAIDDAVRALNAGQVELGMSLMFDALNEMYLCDIFASGNERDKDYRARLAVIYGQKPVNLAAMEGLNEKVRQAIKEDRIQLAKAAAIKRNAKNREMRTLVIDHWSSDKHSYEGNKSDFARHYARRLLQEYAFEVEATTIATRWLRGL